MLGHLPSGFLRRKNRVIELQAFNRHNVKRVHTHTYKYRHTQQNVRRRRKPRLPLLATIPGWKVSQCGLSPICATVGLRPASHPEPTQVTLHQPEHNHLHSTVSHVFIQLLWSFRRNHNGNKKELLSLCTQPWKQVSDLLTTINTLLWEWKCVAKKKKGSMAK